MGKRGPTPSLISGTHGAVKFHVTGKKIDCRRCTHGIPGGTRCVRVSKPGTMGQGRAYCVECFGDVLDETQRQLDRLRLQLDQPNGGKRSTSAPTNRSAG